MARPRRIDKALVAKARQVVARATEVEELRAAQAVLLPALASATLEQTAAILGVGRATVPRLQQRLRQSVRSRARRSRWGGRAQGATECRARSGVFGSVGRAGQGSGTVSVVTDPGGAGATVGPCGGGLGGVAAVSPARVAQGGPGHAPPKSDPAAQEAWKKNSPKRWVPY